MQRRLIHIGDCACTTEFTLSITSFIYYIKQYVLDKADYNLFAQLTMFGML